MAGITLAQAEAQLANWLAASEAVALNQSYSISGRTLTRANADHIQKQVEFWDSKVKQLAAIGTNRRGPRYMVGE